MKISDILNQLDDDYDANNHVAGLKNARLAIYKAGLEAIGEKEAHESSAGLECEALYAHPEDCDCGATERNELRAEQRKEWKQLCGIEGESDDN